MLDGGIFYAQFYYSYMRSISKPVVRDASDCPYRPEWYTCAMVWDVWSPRVLPPINVSSHRLTCSSPSASIIKDTFDKAKTVLREELDDKQYDELFTAHHQSLDDLKATLQTAQSKYKDKSSSKASIWLRSFSSRVTLYGSVLDVVCQHHPEYSSLAWGAFKILFIVSI